GDSGSVRADTWCGPVRHPRWLRKVDLFGLPVSPQLLCVLELLHEIVAQIPSSLPPHSLGFCRRPSSAKKHAFWPVCSRFKVEKQGFDAECCFRLGSRFRLGTAAAAFLIHKRWRRLLRCRLGAVLKKSKLEDLLTSVGHAANQQIMRACIIRMLSIG